MGTIEETYKTDIEFNGDLGRTEGQGDLNTVSGLENVRAALLRRLVTIPGSVPHRPEYGVGIKEYQNAPMTIPVQRKLALDIRDNFARDERVKEVKSVGINYDQTNPAKTTIVVRIDLVGYGEVEATYIPFGGEA